MGALIVLIAACVVSEFFWWVVGFVAVGVAVYYAVKFCNAADRKQLARLNNRLDLAALSAVVSVIDVEISQRVVNGGTPSHVNFGVGRPQLTLVR